jgi:tetratricopeptide (TPR) repeat protein
MAACGALVLALAALASGAASAAVDRAASSTAPASVAPRGPTAPRLSGFDGFHFPLDSRDPRARRWFDQGMLLAYGFNPEEAVRSFEAALAIDPACATCWWALAWALGPNINADMPPQAAARVEAALAQARRHAHRAGPAQRALIDALSGRHPRGGAVDEAAYARRMQASARRFPRDAEVALLAAEALMNLHPYDWWTPGGAAQPWTIEIERLLDRAIALRPRHPGAHHYRIHLYETSLHPQRALASADVLRDAVPGSGHLLHMPAHIDMRVGRYEAAIRASLRAIEADQRYLAEVDAQKAYRVGYVAHNHHFLWAAASMAGQRALATQAAQAAWPAACGPSGRDPGTAIAQQYAVLPYFTLVRFGQWDTLLRDTRPPDAPGPYPLAIWHYARGTAHARTGQGDAARQQLERLERLAAEPSLGALTFKNINPATELMRIAVLTLRADIALAGGDAPAAVASLREATRIEDALQADEPHQWLAPTRHALGAALLAARLAVEAEQVYRQDLRHYPDNAWSLHGLARALEQQGRMAPARQARDAARQVFDRAQALPPDSRF